MPKPTPQPLTLDQVAELAEKSLQNAIDLIAEAEILARIGSPRGLALCILAAEEFGKHMMCFTACARGPNDDTYWKDFWQRFRSHNPKYDNAFSMVVYGLPSEHQAKVLAEFDRHVEADLDRKMAAFYVDVADGDVEAPYETISQESINGTLEIIRYLIRSWAEHHAVDDWKAYFQAGLDAGAREVLAALDRDDEEAVRRLFENRPSGP